MKKGVVIINTSRGALVKRDSDRAGRFEDKEGREDSEEWALPCFHATGCPQA
jgi:hypothetical protein